MRAWRAQTRKPFTFAHNVWSPTGPQTELWPRKLSAGGSYRFSDSPN